MKIEAHTKEWFSYKKNVHLETMAFVPEHVR